MSDPMAEIRASFFVECEELLEALQDGLQAMEGGESDPETVNIVFRAVHSIKGGAGAFGLDRLVAFAHVFETALDEVRAGRLEADAANLSVFFRGGDILSDLVRTSRDSTNLPESETDPVLKELEALVGDVGGEADVEEVADFEPMALDFSFDDDDAAGDADPGLPSLPPLDGLDETEENEGTGGTVTVHFRPHMGLYESGNDPVPLFRSLSELGTLSAECRWESLPTLSEYEGKVAFLSWTLHLETDADDEAIREVFEFAEGRCDFEISRGEVDPSTTAPDLPPLEASAPFELASGADLTDVAPEGMLSAAPDIATPTIEPASAPNEQAIEQAETAKPAAPPAPATKNAPAAATASATVRVDLERIDRLVNLVGELVINQAMLSQSVGQSELPSNSPVHTGLDEFMQLTRDIQESVMMIRAQPVKSLFQRMSRIVREGSAAVGKEVRLVTTGEATEIDKTVIERLADPLTHMVRNAVDHGLESNDDREAAGKPREGRINLSAAHRSGRVVIDVSDDGGGINREKVLAKAIEKGLVPADQDLSDGEIDNLLFMPGFSTADEISNLSGRGVGMDVVRNAITALGGRISIQSAPGAGTTFSISLPLTLAVLDGMVVQSAGETLVVPLSAIAETLTLTENDIRALGPQTTVVQVRDNFVPLIDLATELGYSDPRESYVGAIVLLIAFEDGSRSALAIDAIEDQRQVVIKGLEESYGHIPGVAAATILGDGQIALILDPADLILNASGRSRRLPNLQAAG